MGIILEKEAEDFLEKQGFSVVKRAFVRQQKDLDRINLSFPWIMKVSSPKIVHKYKAGGIVMNIKSLSESKNAFDKLKKLPGFEGVVIQEMISGQKLILGLKNTQEFGLTIMLGTGGVKVEELKDVTFRVCPIKEKDAKEMIDEIKSFVKNPKLVIKNLIRLSKLANKFPTLQELDINPLIVNKSGAIVVDARFVASKRYAGGER